MLRTIAVIGLLPLLLLASPASAAPTKAQKMETCKFGADDQKLEGAKRNDVHQEVHGPGQFRAARSQSHQEDGQEDQEAGRHDGASRAAGGQPAAAAQAVVG